MAYRMTQLTPQVLVGINARGDAHIEVWEPDSKDPDAEVYEIFIPHNALEDLAKFFIRAST